MKYALWAVILYASSSASCTESCSDERRSSALLLWVMGVFYIVAGLPHFVAPGRYLPDDAALAARASRAHPPVGRRGGGARRAVLVPATRRLAAWGLILLLIAIFPANVHIALHDVPLFGATEGAGVWNWVRLPFQLVLILWAWWYT